MTTNYVTISPQNKFNQNYSACIVENDPGIINLAKGAFWGIAAFKLGAATIAAGTYTAVTSPLLVTPLAGIPIALGCTTLFLASLTGSSIDNVSYNLSSRKIVILHTN